MSHVLLTTRTYLQNKLAREIKLSRFTYHRSQHACPLLAGGHRAAKEVVRSVRRGILVGAADAGYGSVSWALVFTEANVDFNSIQFYLNLPQLLHFFSKTPTVTKEVVD